MTDTESDPLDVTYSHANTRHQQQSLVYNRVSSINLLFGCRQQDLLTLLIAVLDPWMIENVRCWESTTWIGNEQTRHQILGLVRDLSPVTLRKWVVSVAYTLKQSILNKHNITNDNLTMQSWTTLFLYSAYQTVYLNLSTELLQNWII